MKVGEGKVCKGERGAFRAGEDNVSAMAVVVGEGRTKDESTVTVRVP